MSISETEINAKLVVSSINIVGELVDSTITELEKSLTSAEKLVAEMEEKEEIKSTLGESIRVAAALAKRLGILDEQICEVALHYNGEVLDTAVQVAQSIIKSQRGELSKSIELGGRLERVLRG